MLINSPRHWPTPMQQYGTNPYGENLYRIVFAPSRLHVVSGEWPDGANCARCVPRYPHFGDQWILERWLSADEYAGMSRQQWEREMLILGPWPERGEYDLAHVFEACSPDEASLDKLIRWIEAGRRRSYSENRTACKANYDAERKAIDSKAEEMLQNAWPAFGSAPMVGYARGRGSKTAPLVRSANELGLPIGQNKFTTVRNNG